VKVGYDSVHVHKDTQGRILIHIYGKDSIIFSNESALKIYSREMIKYCKKCGYVWLASIKEVLQCPNCHTTRWNQDPK